MMIFACALRDDLLAAAWSGDPEARRLLTFALPADMPWAIRKAYRDAQIRALAAQLFGWLNTRKVDPVAQMIALAGLQSHAGFTELRGYEFDLLVDDERAYLMTAVTSTISRIGDVTWPKKRQISEILENLQSGT
jgi:hypothetical protein